MKIISPQMDAYLAGTWQTNARCLKLTMFNHQPEIVGVSNANPCVITTKWAHGWSSDYLVRIINVRGGTLGDMLNFGEFVIAVLSPTTFSIPIDTTALDSYEWQGIAQRIIGFTTYQQGLTFESLFYNASKAYLPSSVRALCDFTVSNFTLNGVLSSEAITDIDIQRELYANARLDFFMVNYRNLSMGKIWLPGGRGNIGQVVTKRKSYEAEFKAFEHYLQQEIGHIYAPLCRADLGYDGQGSEDTDDINLCKVKVDPPFWRPLTVYELRPARDAGLGSVVKPTTPTNPPAHFRCVGSAPPGLSGSVEPTWDPVIGNRTFDNPYLLWEAIEPLTKTSTVSEVINQRFEFSDTARTEPDQWYRYGILTWLTGDNIGMKFSIKNFHGFPYPIVSVSTASKIFRIAGDQTSFFSATQTFEVSGSTGNDSVFDIVGVDIKTKVFRIDGNYAAKFVAGITFDVDGSPRNDGTYEVEDSSYDAAVNQTVITTVDPPIDASVGGQVRTVYTIDTVTYVSATDRTEITVLEIVPSAVADGVIRHFPKIFEFFRDTPFDIQIGDEFEIRAGCDKRRETCINKFDNIYNFRGEPFVPGMDKYLQTPDAKP